MLLAESWRGRDERITGDPAGTGLDFHPETYRRSTLQIAKRERSPKQVQVDAK